MKNIFLIGDSIRYGAQPRPITAYGKVINGPSPGYGVYVKELTEGVANVYAPDDNCRFAQYTLRYIHGWAGKVPAEEIDVVHWNNGLWDALRLYGDDPMTPIEVYGHMLKRVHKHLRMVFPKAKIIFGLSTSVNEDWADPDFIRFNHEIEQYNAKAREVMAELGVEVNDLYSLSCTFPKEYHSDWVHFGDEGSKLLAEAVVKACMAE